MFFIVLGGGESGGGRQLSGKAEKGEFSKMLDKCKLFFLKMLLKVLEMAWISSDDESKKSFETMNERIQRHEDTKRCFSGLAKAMERIYSNE